MHHPLWRAEPWTLQGWERWNRVSAGRRERIFVLLTQVSPRGAQLPCLGMLWMGTPWPAPAWPELPGLTWPELPGLTCPPSLPACCPAAAPSPFHPCSALL